MSKYYVKQEGCVPFPITEKQYNTFVKQIKDEKKKKIEAALQEAFDFFYEDEFIEIVEDKINELIIRG